MRNQQNGISPAFYTMCVLTRYFFVSGVQFKRQNEPALSGAVREIFSWKFAVMGIPLYVVHRIRIAGVWTNLLDF